MMLTKSSIKNPYTITAMVFVVVSLGLFAFWRTPIDLFPETSPPQVAVVTVYPGAAARDVVDKITWVLEREINTLSGLTRITSTSRDEVSSIRAEFSYDKSVGEAVLDVQNAVARLSGDLPDGAQVPRIYRITDATRPLLTLSLTPKMNSVKTLTDIRLLADNDIKNALLRVPGVGDVQVFGGHQPEVEVLVDRDALTAHGLTLGDAIARLASQNVSAPAGTIYGSKKEYLIRVAGEFQNTRALERLPLKSIVSGGQVCLRDVATVSLSEADPRSFYHGNGKPAIALNVLRPDGGNTIETIHNVKAFVKELERQHPDIEFGVTEDQKPIIDINFRGMCVCLCQAVVLTSLVIFFFLGNARAAAFVSVSIPLSFLSALAVIGFSPFTLNMVTLSGLIVAVGMVVDASVVVIENISRHYSARSVPDDARRASLEGTSEVALPITAGMLTTVIVLMPVMFTGGFLGRITLPLTMTIVSTLIASLLISLTVIPVLAGRFLDRKDRRKNVLKSPFAYIDRTIGALGEAYIRLVRWSLRHRAIFTILALAFLMCGVKLVKPLIGGEQMPPMDTGIAVIEFDMASGSRPREVEMTLERVEQMVYRTPGVLTVSSVVGSEPGTVSFGAGSATIQSAKMTIRLVERTRRDQSIWQIQQVWRDALRTLPGVRSYRVSEYGATPVSTTKAPLNVILSGPDPVVLDRLADQALALLRGTPGLTDLRRSWYADKPQQTVTVDPQLAILYGTSPAEVGQNLRAAVQGVPATNLRLNDFLGVPVRVRYRSDLVAEPERLGEVVIPTVLGPAPLRALATIKNYRESPFITRENLKNTIDLTAGNHVLTISQLEALAKERVKQLKLPAGYDLTVAGSAADFAGLQKELRRALMIGLVLLYILLIAIFRSYILPISIMSAIPLAVVGALWGLLIFDKPLCMPASMGIILLGGTIVNNSILILEFITRARRKGMSLDEAIVQSIRLRLRPILMTTTSTIVGFTPLIFEMAVGLERMSPLGVVACAGLLAGTMVTTIATPVFYAMLESVRKKCVKLLPGLRRVKNTIVLILVSTTFVITSVPSRAQETLSEPLSLEDAVRYALHHSPGLRTAQAEVEIMDGTETIVRAAKGVHLDLLASAAVSQENRTLVPRVASNIQRFDDELYKVVLNARYLLSDFGQTSAKVKSADARIREATFMLNRKTQEVIFEVSRLFLSTLSVKDMLEAARASEKSLAALAVTTDSLYIAGRAARVDALKVQARLARVESEIASLQARQRILKAALAAVLGWKHDLPDLTYRRPDIPQEPGEGQKHIAETGPKRPDVAAAMAQKESTSADLIATLKAYFPKIEAFGSYAYYGANDPVPAISGGPTGRWEDDAAVGVKFTWSILDGRLRRGQLAEAFARDKAAEATLERRQLVSRQEISAAQADLESAIAQVNANSRAVVQAEEALRVEKLMYATGKGTINYVLDAEAVHLEAESLKHRALRQTEIARLRLDLALGRIKIEGIQKQGG